MTKKEKEEIKEIKKNKEDKAIKKPKKELNTHASNNDVVYAVILSEKTYKNILDKNEYIIRDNGDILLGLYKNFKFAQRKKEKFNKRGLYVTIITE